MIFAPLGCLAAILLFLSIPLILVLFFLNLVSFSFGQLGLSPATTMALILAMLAGSLINIPLTRRRVTYSFPATIRGLFAQPQYSGVALNVGGAVIPIALSIYLVTRMPSVWQVLVATVVMAAVAKALARVVPGRGVVLPVFVPPLVSALLAVLLAPQFAAPCAYVSGTMGTLIGADLLNAHRLRGFPGMLAIGGAGVFDGIFLVGIVAVLLTALV